MITRHIADLLYYHDCVIVPGLGGFIKAYRPAQIVHARQEFHPPSATIAFNAGLSVNDGLLANHIASVQNTSYREALYEIKQWVDTCLDSVKKNDKINLDGIGEFFMNASGKLEFSPSFQVNFNTDSFGLPVFISKTAANKTFTIPEIQTGKHNNKRIKLHRLIPETLKWAAVLAPFVAFVLWGSLNGNIIENYVHNYTGMYSWVRSTPGKTAPVKAISYAVKATETPKNNIESPASILAGENITFNPGMVSYAELDKNNIVISESAPLNTSETIAGDENYFIIGGAFRDQNNALNLVTALREQGYPAAVVDTTTTGLYIVSMKGFSKYSEASGQLSEIKKAGFPSSWILKKQKG